MLDFDTDVVMDDGAAVDFDPAVLAEADAVIDASPTLSSGVEEAVIEEATVEEAVVEEAPAASFSYTDTDDAPAAPAFEEAAVEDYIAGPAYSEAEAGIAAAIVTFNDEVADFDDHIEAGNEVAARGDVEAMLAALATIANDPRLDPDERSAMLSDIGRLQSMARDPSVPVRELRDAVVAASNSYEQAVGSTNGRNATQGNEQQERLERMRQQLDRVEAATARLGEVLEQERENIDPQLYEEAMARKREMDAYVAANPRWRDTPEGRAEYMRLASAYSDAARDTGNDAVIREADIMDREIQAADAAMASFEAVENDELANAASVESPNVVASTSGFGTATVSETDTVQDNDEVVLAEEIWSPVLEEADIAELGDVANGLSGTNQPQPTVSTGRFA